MVLVDRIELQQDSMNLIAQATRVALRAGPLPGEEVDGCRDIVRLDARKAGCLPTHEQGHCVGVEPITLPRATSATGTPPPLLPVGTLVGIVSSCSRSSA